MIVVIISFFLELWLDDRCRKTGMSKDTFFASFFFETIGLLTNGKKKKKELKNV